MYFSIIWEYKSMSFDKPVTFIPNYYDKLSLITLYLLVEFEVCQSRLPIRIS
jgi:hypothetical protein